MEKNIDIQKLLDIARQAGAAILEVYESDDFNVELKDDNSPLTRADKASHNIIASALAKLYPEIPILSEEGKDMSFEERKDWGYFWCVDPLDGTKEFIKRNGEFTVNIALIKKDKPVLGVIYAPVLKTMYYNDAEGNAYKQIDGEEAVLLKITKPESDWIAVQSRSHSSEAETEFYSKYNIVDTISVGSSLKFCMIAEGKAHIYFRGGPTMEWDTASGHAIVNAAGGSVEFHSGELYNKEILRNSGFTVSV